MIRFGVVGTNTITDKFISQTSQNPDFLLNSVCSRSSETAMQFAKKYGLDPENTFTDLREMAASGAIDAVYIATPNAFHAEQSILFLENKIPVLCEKPITSNTAELEAVITAAKQNNVLFMEAMVTPHLPAFECIKQNISKIGTIRRIFLNYCQYSSRYDRFKSGELPNAFNPVLSNGSLMDIGIYCISAMIRLAGVPKKVYASATVLSSGADGSGTLVCGYDGFDAVIMHSKVSDSKVYSEIQGENGSILIDSINVPAKIILAPRGGIEEDVTPVQIFPPMYYETTEFINLLKLCQTESAVNSFETSLRVMAVLDEARRQCNIVFSADK